MDENMSMSFSSRRRKRVNLPKTSVSSKSNCLPLGISASFVLVSCTAIALISSRISRLAYSVVVAVLLAQLDRGLHLANDDIGRLVPQHGREVLLAIAHRACTMASGRGV